MDELDAGSSARRMYQRILQRQCEPTVTHGYPCVVSDWQCRCRFLLLARTGFERSCCFEETNGCLHRTGTVMIDAGLRMSRHARLLGHGRVAGMMNKKIRSRMAETGVRTSWTTKHRPRPRTTDSAMNGRSLNDGELVQQMTALLAERNRKIRTCQQPRQAIVCPSGEELAAVLDGAPLKSTARATFVPRGCFR